MKKLLAVIFLCSATAVSIAQLTPQEYISTYKDLAVKEMKRSGIPASITLAQGLLETENGNSDLLLRSNNHFGIKCKSSWTGESVRHTDDAPNECFRKYASAEDSYADHSNFLMNSTRYASLFTLRPNDYKGWAYGLKNAGYATNPRYPLILIGHIEKYQLNLFDDTSYVFVPDNLAKKDVEINTANPVKIKLAASVENNTVTVQPDERLIAGKTKINGIKAIFGSKGVSLLAIAMSNDVELSKLLEYNDLQADGLLQQDQVIYLERKNKQGNRPEYVSEKTETLHQVSQNLGIQLQYLAQYNSLAETSTVKKGQKIFLKPGAMPQANSR